MQWAGKRDGLMKDIILFGAGFWGDAAYFKLQNSGKIIFYVDNDKNKTGLKLHNIEIINLQRLEQIYDSESMDIIIASRYFAEIGEQLCDIGITEYYVWAEGLLYRKDREKELFPCETEEIPPCMKQNGKGSILFVQSTACIRTHKIANALKKSGWNVFLLYAVISPKYANPEYEAIYNAIYTVDSIDQLTDFVNKSDFDVIHSSNEPDLLTMLLNQTTKPVIHDCHDLSSAYKSMTPEEMCIEFAANKNSAGVIYTTEGIREEAIRKFGIAPEKTFVLENLISEELTPEKRYGKISASDKELHCVYEGGVVPYDRESHRYFEEIWVRLAECGVHIHFYTNCEKQACLYIESLHEKIHYEGNLSSKQLAEEMTKYDVGLCILNVTEKNRQYLEYASPNKIQEYINAGIPVAVGDVESQKNFVEENGFGKKIDFRRGILEQLKEVAQIEIEASVLHKKGMTLESKIPQLIDFYHTCKYK